MDENTIKLNSTKIYEKVFTPNVKGYDPDEVDNFLDENQKMLKDVKVIYVTGGGINYIRGALNHIGERLSMNFESIMPDIPQFNKPIYSSSIGLLDNALSKRSK